MTTKIFSLEEPLTTMTDTHSTAPLAKESNKVTTVWKEVKEREEREREESNKVTTVWKEVKEREERERERNQTK